MFLYDIGTDHHKEQLGPVCLLGTRLPSFLYKARQYLCTREDEIDPQDSLMTVSDQEQEKVDVRPRSSTGTFSSKSCKPVCLKVDFTEYGFGR